MAGEKPQKSPDSTESKVPFLKVTLDRSHIVGKSEKDCTSRFSLKQKFAALALLAGMSSLAYCHSTAEAPAPSKTTATAEPFETPDQPAKFVMKGNEVNFMTDDGEVDVEKVNQQVLSGIAARFDEMHDPTEVDYYAADTDLTVSKTDEKNGVDDSLTIKTEREDTPGHPGQETVRTYVLHNQWYYNTKEAATLDTVVLVTPYVPLGAGTEGSSNRITSQGFLDLVNNPGTKVERVMSFDPNADETDQAAYTTMVRDTDDQGKEIFTVHMAPGSSTGSTAGHVWQTPRRGKDTRRVVTVTAQYWA